LYTEKHLRLSPVVWCTKYHQGKQSYLFTRLSLVV